MGETESVSALTIVVAGVAGLLIGSFLTVVTDRVPDGRSVMAPGSACPACGHRLGARDLVPVLSWLMRRGKCGRCGAGIGAEAIVLELSTATAFVLLAVRFEPLWLLAAHCSLVSALVALTAIDLRTRRLPREITYSAVGLGVPLLAIAALSADEPRRIWTALLGALIATAVMLALHLVSRESLGDGDVRLSPLLGLHLGWWNPGLALVGLFFGFALGAVVGVAMMLTGRAGRRTAIPFGPFLALGALVALFVGQDFIDAVMVR